MEIQRRFHKMKLVHHFLIKVDRIFSLSLSLTVRRAEVTSRTPGVHRRAKEEGAGGVATSKKRPNKMADLRAFVESRLLSRSDKALEKVDAKYRSSATMVRVLAEENHLKRPSYFLVR